MPWKNGRGTTTQLAIYPPDAQFPQDPFLWRVSSAPITENGDFSSFPGFDRLLMITDGSGILLNGDRLSWGESICFSGETPSSCELIEGPVRDLGVIYRPDALKVSMNLASTTKEIPLRLALNSKFQLFVCVRGEFRANETPSQVLTAGECFYSVPPGSQSTLELTALTENAALVCIDIAEIG